MTQAPGITSTIMARSNAHEGSWGVGSLRTAIAQVEDHDFNHGSSSVTSEGAQGEFRWNTREVTADSRRARLAASSEIAKSGRPGVPQEFRVSGLDRWEGRVVEADGEIFTAELRPERPGPVLLAEFGVDKIGEPVGVGDVVYVTVRSVSGRTGFSTTTAAVRLRRLGRWTDDDVARFEERAEQRAREFERFLE